MKSIGVMTRGKAEAKYFPSREENLRLSEIEKEKCVEERARIENGERSHTRRTSRWNKGGGKGRMHLCSGTIRAPQAEEKLSAGFEFEKQMKKFNDVELRCRALPTGRR